jgi:hypothetical protein
MELHKKSLHRTEVKRRAKTATERALIKSAIRAINSVRTEIDLNPIRFPMRNIHFVNSAEHKAGFKNFEPGDQGRNIVAQVFISDCHDDTLISTLFKLTHELTHVMSPSGNIWFAPAKYQRMTA